MAKYGRTKISLRYLLSKVENAGTTTMTTTKEMQCQVSLPPVDQTTKSFLIGPSETGMKNAHGWLPAFNGRPLIREGLRGNSACCGRSLDFIVPRWHHEERWACLEECQGQKFPVGQKNCWSPPRHSSTTWVSEEQASLYVCVVLLWRPLKKTHGNLEIYK